MITASGMLLGHLVAFAVCSGSSAFSYCGRRSSRDVTREDWASTVRSTAAGVAAQFTVNFGVGGGGEAFASVVSAPKLAA